MVRNAHLLCFFRRICKFLNLRTKPVFVFDGATPALKRRTVIARRRLRENARAKIRKTAEKLLLNQLKSMRLKELAKDLEKQNAANKKGKQTKILEENKRVPEKLDEMLAASIAAEECGSLNNNASTSVAVAAVEEGKGKEILSDHTDIEGSNMGRDHMAAESYD